AKKNDQDDQWKSARPPSKRDKRTSFGRVPIVPPRHRRRARRRAREITWCFGCPPAPPGTSSVHASQPARRRRCSKAGEGNEAQKAATPPHVRLRPRRSSPAGV